MRTAPDAIHSPVGQTGSLPNPPPTTSNTLTTVPPRFVVDENQQPTDVVLTVCEWREVEEGTHHSRRTSSISTMRSADRTVKRTRKGGALKALSPSATGFPLASESVVRVASIARTAAVTAFRSCASSYRSTNSASASGRQMTVYRFIDHAMTRVARARQRSIVPAVRQLLGSKRVRSRDQKMAGQKTRAGCPWDQGSRRSLGLP